MRSRGCLTAECRRGFKGLLSLICGQKQTHRPGDELMVTKSKGWAGDRLGAWDQHVYTALFKMDNHKDLLYCIA